jgi:hypothetical protein
VLAPVTFLRVAVGVEHFVCGAGLADSSRVSALEADRRHDSLRAVSASVRARRDATRSLQAVCSVERMGCEKEPGGAGCEERVETWVLGARWGSWGLNHVAFADDDGDDGVG